MGGRISGPRPEDTSILGVAVSWNISLWLTSAIHNDVLAISTEEMNPHVNTCKHLKSLFAVMEKKNTFGKSSTTMSVIKKLLKIKCFKKGINILLGVQYVLEEIPMEVLSED